MFAHIFSVQSRHELSMDKDGPELNECARVAASRQITFWLFTHSLFVLN